MPHLKQFLLNVVCTRPIYRLSKAWSTEPRSNKCANSEVSLHDTGKQLLGSTTHIQSNQLCQHRMFWDSSTTNANHSSNESAIHQILGDVINYMSIEQLIEWLWMIVVSLKIILVWIRTKLSWDLDDLRESPKRARFRAFWSSRLGWPGSTCARHPLHPSSAHLLFKKNMAI